jgi:glycosyltransferase involved in cell wall biosynthesis
LVKESSIPEARNICIQKMKGDYLFFWDSDVIMEPTALTCMLETLRKENVDIVLPFITPVNVDSADGMDQKWREWETKYPRREETKIIQVAGTSDFLISKIVLKQVAFDPDLTFFEDQDFSSHATRQGFKILLTRNVIGFDLKSEKPYSDIYFDMSLRNTFRGLRKKAAMQAQTVTKGATSTSGAVTRFLWANKRYLFYIGYVPAIALTLVGVLLQNLWLTLILPLYFLLYAIVQFKKRGFARGLKALMRSFIVGVPTTYALLYYCLKLSLKKTGKGNA